MTKAEHSIRIIQNIHARWGRKVRERRLYRTWMKASYGLDNRTADRVAVKYLPLFREEIAARERGA